MTKTILVKAVTRRSAGQKITGALDGLVRPMGEALPGGQIGLKEAEVGAALANCRALINQINAGLSQEGRTTPTKAWGDEARTQFSLMVPRLRTLRASRCVLDRQPLFLSAQGRLHAQIMSEVSPPRGPNCERTP
jgi:hypothetical protein